MSKKSDPRKSAEFWPDRKAHASLVHEESKFQEGLMSAHPDLVDAKGDCPQCVSLEHTLADPAMAEQTARELT